MPIDNPSTLVEEFKKTGEFDRLRRELLTQFQRDDSFSGFKSRIEDIARQRLTSDQMLHYLPQDLVHKELRQEVDRFPVVERAVAEVRILSDPSFLASIQTSVQKILQVEKGGIPAITKDEGIESVKPRTLIPDASVDHPEKTVQDAQVPDPSKFSAPMVTEVLRAPTDPGPSKQSPISLTVTSATSLLTTVPSQHPPREDEIRNTSIRNSNPESTNLPKPTPQIARNDVRMLIDETNNTDVEMKSM